MSLQTPTALRAFAKRSARACARFALLLALSPLALPAAAVTLPGPPQNVTTGSYAVSGQPIHELYVDWDTPVVWGDVPVTGYQVTRNPDGVQQQTNSDTTYAVFDNVVKGSSYSFTVRAITGSGLGAPATSNTTVLTTVPGAPVMGSATLNGTTAYVTFSAPADNGGTPITGYRVTGAYSSMVDLDEGSTALTHRVTGIPPGENVWFWALAHNAVGWSDASANSNTVLTYPKLSVLDVSVVEGNAGTKTVSVEVRVDNTSQLDAQFTLVSSNGTAIAGSDYVAASFPSETMYSGTSYRLYNFTIKGDSTPEPNETFTVTLSNPVNATIEKAQATVTILDDDGAVAPSLSISDVSLKERNSGTQVATFTVTASQPTTQTMTFNIATSDGTATAGSDYVAKSQSALPIFAGFTSQTFSVVINGDTAVEADETFTVTLSNPVNAILADAQGVGTIINDDAVISIGDATPIAEGNGGTTTFTFPVTLSVALPDSVFFQLETADGTATSASGDYWSQGGTSNWYINPGQTTVNVTVTVNGDLLFEDDETFFLKLINISGAIPGDTQGTGTILNDDVPFSPSLQVQDASTGEGNAPTKDMVFTVNLGGASQSVVGFDVALVAGSAQPGSDYLPLSVTHYTMPIGETSKAITVQVVGDTVQEVEYEYFQLVISNVTGATPYDTSAQGTIIDDDTPGIPSLSVGDVSVAEGSSGDHTVTVPITLSGPPSHDVMFNVYTQPATAISGSGMPNWDDFDYISSSVTIPAGQTSASVTVTVHGDQEVEEDEYFTVNVSSLYYAVMDKPTGKVTLLDDDYAGPLPAVSVGDISLTEGNAGTKQATFTATLSQASGRAVSFGIATSDWNSLAGSDYVAKTMTGITIPAGDTSATFSVTVNGDTQPEPDEMFVVDLVNVSGATIADGQAFATILNDDGAPLPTLSISDASLTEGTAGTKIASFTVSLSSAYTSPVTFGIATADWNAIAGTDYLAKALVGQSIPAGQTSKTFEVLVNGDTTVEFDEIFYVNVANVSGATVSDAQAVGTIVNDDFVGALSIADVTVTEGNAGTRTAIFTVSLSSPLAVPVSFDLATADWNGLAGSDYVARSQTGLVIPAGQSSLDFAVTVNGDMAVEADELFVVDISNASGAAVADSRAFATIANDDPTLTVANASTSEGNAGTKALTFTVSLSQSSPVPVTLNYHTTAGGTAQSSDYVAVPSGSMQIAAGQVSGSFAVQVNGDAVAEPNETFYVILDSATNAVIGNPMQPVGQVAVGTIANDDAATISAARIDAMGLYDDLDDGRKEPVLSAKEYATLLLDVATQVCQRAQAATVVGVDRVENLAVLRELADTANTLCPDKPRYGAVMAATKGEGTGFLVEATDAKDVRGVEVVGKPRVDAVARIDRLVVQGSGHAGPTTVLLPRGLSAKVGERSVQLRALGQRVQAELKANPKARLVLIGDVTVPGLVDLTARALAAQQSKLPAERVQVSPALLQEFEAARVEFPKLPANAKPAQVLQLRR